MVASIPILFWTVIVVLLLYLPLGNLKVNLEYKLYTDKRIEIIQMIQNNKLTDDGIGNIKLPDKYMYLSSDGEVHVYQNDSEGTIVGFWVMRGMLGAYTTVLYSSFDGYLDDSALNEGTIQSCTKLGDHWYFVKAE